MGVMLWLLLREKIREQRVAVSILIPYLFLVFAATLLARRVRNDVHLIISPFWKIRAIMNGGASRAWLRNEFLLNVLLMLQIGVLAPVFFINRRFLWTVVAGVGVSISIEMLQFLTHRGFAEIDDVIFNTLGVLVGFGIYSLIQKGRAYAQQ